MAGIFTKASKKSKRLRLAIDGPSGSGKTWTALAVATGLGSRIALVDTERGSASLYSDMFEFDAAELGDFDPRNYIEYLQNAENAGYDVVILDSLSHAWTGKGGALEKVDKVVSRSQSGNSFVAWREVTPLHNALVDAILQSRCHVIATMRTKVDYAMEPNNQGKLVPVKIGLAPIQREGMDYEFDVVCDMRLNHDMVVSKTRCNAIDGLILSKPGREFGETLRNWLEFGKAVPTKDLASEDASQRRQAATGAVFSAPVAAPSSLPVAQPVGLVTAGTVALLVSLKTSLGLTEEQWLNALAKRGVAKPESLTTEQGDEIVRAMEVRLAKKQEQEDADRQAANKEASPEQISEHASAPTSAEQIMRSVEDDPANTFPFEDTATPEATAAHQAEQQTKVSLERSPAAQNGVVAQSSDTNESQIADEFEVPDQIRPEKAESTRKPRTRKPAASPTTPTDTELLWPPRCDVFV